MTFLGCLRFCKRCLESWFLWLGIKIGFMIFLLNIYYLSFIHELSSTNVTLITSYMCWFMCKRHWKHCYVKCVENDSRKLENTCKKKPKHILVPSQRYHDSRHILQNPKVPRNIMGFSHRAQTFTFLNHLSWDSL